jgi:hypothetical protein
MTKLGIETLSPAESTLPAAGIRPELLAEPPGPAAHGFLPKLYAGLGVFLVVLGIYVLTSPGRIDIVDGEARFDIAYSLVAKGRPIFTDPLIGSLMGVPGRGGDRYSFYGAPGSVFAMPLVWLGLRAHPSTIQPVQFLFSLTSPILGAGIAPILFLFYLELGVTLRKAVLWTLVTGFATLVWPVSNSTFDNAQHAFFALAALYCAFLSAKRNSKALAIVGGLLAAILILYQEYFTLLAPLLALAVIDWKSRSDVGVAPSTATREPALARADAALKRTFRSGLELVRQAWDAPGDARSSCVRYVLFGVASSLGLVLTLAYNDYRFGSWFNDGKFSLAGPPLFGSPVLGLLTLLVSPGKSVFLYSPTLVLGLLGFGQLRRRSRELAGAIAGCGVVLVLFLSCILCVGGDWCWGPRYLTPLLPFFSLAFPFTANIKIRRWAIVAVVALGLLVQVLALSVENQRFFFERGLNDFFWAEHPAFYLTHSALFARFGEVASLRQGVPATARFFTSVPQTDLATYSLLGPPPQIPRNLAPLWMRDFKIFYLPRPWPLWMSYLPAERRPIDMSNWIVGLTGVGLLGSILVLLGLRTKEQV